MQWILTQSQNSSPVLRISLLSFMRAALLSLCFLASLLLCSFSRADEVVSRPLSVEDLSAEEFDELASFSVALRSVTASSTGNITNDVAAILDLLLEVRNQSQSYIPRLVTYPTAYLNSNASIGQVLNNLFSDRGVTGSMPSANQSYLFQIREAIKAFNFADPSWTNNLSSLVDLLTNVDLSTYQTQRDVGSISMDVSSALTVLQDLDSNTLDIHYLYPIYTNQVAFADWIGSFEYGHGSQWGVHVDDTQWGEILQALYGSSETTSNLWGGVQSTWGDLADVFTGIEQYLKTIHEDDFDFDGGGDRSLRLDLGYWNARDQSRSIAEDFHFMHQQLGVERPSATNNIYYLLSRLLDDGPALSVVASMSNEVASVTSAERSTRSEEDAATNLVATVAEEQEPDWEEHKYTGDNPIETFSSSVESSARSIIGKMTPNLPDSTLADKTIVLYRGNFPIFGGAPSSRSSPRSVALDISYPLTDHDAVSNGIVTLRSIMEFVWAFVAISICGWFLLRFWVHASAIAAGIAMGHFEERGDL